MANEERSGQFPAQTSKKSSALASDIIKNQNESKDISDKVGLEFKKDKHISNMCSGKPTEGVPLNHKLGTVAKAVKNAIINKDPLKVEHKVGPAKKAVISLNHTKFKDEIPPLSDNDMDDEVNESTCDSTQFIEGITTHNKGKAASTINVSNIEKQNSGHAEDLIKLCAISPLPSQAKETSNKPPQTGNNSVKVKRIKNNVQFSVQTDKEPSVLASDIIKYQSESKGISEKIGLVFKKEDIKLSNHMTGSHMSSKEYHFYQSAHLNWSTLKYQIKDNKDETSSTETISWGMDKYLHVQIVYAHVDLPFALLHNCNAHLDEYLHELIICAYEDLLSALQYNHIHRMDRLKDTAKGRIHKCQFRADGEKITSPHSAHGKLTNGSTFKYPFPQNQV